MRTERRLGRGLAALLGAPLFEEQTPPASTAAAPTPQSHCVYATRAHVPDYMEKNGTPHRHPRPAPARYVNRM